MHYTLPLLHALPLLTSAQTSPVTAIRNAKSEYSEILARLTGVRSDCVRNEIYPQDCNRVFVRFTSCPLSWGFRLMAYGRHKSPRTSHKPTTSWISRPRISFPRCRARPLRLCFTRYVLPFLVLPPYHTFHPLLPLIPPPPHDYTDQTSFPWIMADGNMRIHSSKQASPKSIPDYVI